jgi:hypothetical protein
MNRGAVVFLALAILLAHSLAIHQTPAGDFGPPYEIAHVAYRLGRNLVFHGAALWNPGGAPAESYASVLWVLLSGLAARVYASPVLMAQIVGLVSALATVIVVAQFSTQRASGLVAPVLLAASGSVAAAGLSGTEAALAMLLVTSAFLAFERGMRRTLALALALLVATRPEGSVVLFVLLAFEARWRPRMPSAARRPALYRAYVPALAVLATILVGRRVLTGLWLSPLVAELLNGDPERASIGVRYLGSFAVSSGFALLFVVPIVSLAAGRVSAAGVRALALASAYWTVVTLSGGDDLPFWNALVPALPLFFVGVQDCLREWMDERPVLAFAVWPVLFVTVVAAFLVSKVPGDIGPLRLEEPLTRWQTPRGTLARAYARPTGRLGLLEEIRSVEHLRTLGVFLRDRIDPDASILTSWPGAIGYLSRKEVLDLTGRAWPLPGHARTHTWRGVSRIDVVGALQHEVDYIVPLIGTLSLTDAPADFLHAWLERLDVVGPTDERARELMRALTGFTLVSVPVPVRAADPRITSEQPFPLLQRRTRTLIPALELEIEDDVLRVLASHKGHQLVVDLCVRARLASGEEHYLRPTGSWSAGVPADARTSLLVFPTGSRSIHLVEARIPAELRGARVSAWLHNPGMRPNAPLSPVGIPATGTL